VSIDTGEQQLGAPTLTLTFPNLIKSSLSIIYVFPNFMKILALRVFIYPVNKNRQTNGVENITFAKSCGGYNIAVTERHRDRFVGLVT